MYHIDFSAQEPNLQIAVENEWITDLGSFHADEPSKLHIGPRGRPSDPDRK